MKYQYVAYVMAGPIASHKLPVATGYSDSMRDDDMVEMLTVMMEALPESLRGERQVISIYETGERDALVKSVPHVSLAPRAMTTKDWDRAFTEEDVDTKRLMPDWLNDAEAISIDSTGEVRPVSLEMHKTYCGQGRECNCQSPAYCVMRPKTTGTVREKGHTHANCQCDSPAYQSPVHHIYAPDEHPEHDLHSPNAQPASPTHARRTQGPQPHVHSKAPEDDPNALSWRPGTWPLEW